MFSHDEDDWEMVKLSHELGFCEHILRELWKTAPNEVIDAVNLYRYVIPDRFQEIWFKQPKHDIRKISGRANLNNMPRFGRE